VMLFQLDTPAVAAVDNYGDNYFYHFKMFTTNLLFFFVFFFHIHGVSKTVQNYFCPNFVKFPPSVKISGVLIFHLA